MSRPYTMTELLTAIGDDDLRFQLVAPSLVGNQKARKVKGRFVAGSILQIATDVSLGDACSGDRVGIVLWCDKAKFEAARDKLSSGGEP